MIETRFKKEESKEIEKKILVFNSEGYTLESTSCNSNGNYMFDQSKGVELLPSDCAKSAIMFLSNDGMNLF